MAISKNQLIMLVIINAVVTITIDRLLFEKDYLGNLIEHDRDTTKTLQEIQEQQPVIKKQEEPNPQTTNDEKLESNLSCLGEHESQCLTFPAFKPIKEDLEEFMSTQGNTNGARFVKLLREYLYSDPNWEMERLNKCYKERDLIKCFAGVKNFDSATTPDKVTMPFYDENEENPIFAYEMNKYQDTDHKIAYLGTAQTCLPFFLAGTTITTNGAIIELGPFAGFSSKCLAAGIRLTGPPRENSMIVYDSYLDKANYNAISRACPWVKELYPDYTEDNTDFLQLWKDTVQYVYPKAEPKQMYATSKTLHDGVLGDNALEVFVIDSAKKVRDFHGQIGNLTIPAGSVFFANDFQSAQDNIYLFYACLRHVMIPVFSSFIEQWVWVVKKSFNVNQSWVKKCYAQVSENEQEARDIMIKQATDDISFLISGLTGNDLLTDPSTDPETKEALEYWENRAAGVVIPTLQKVTFSWNALMNSF